MAHKIWSGSINFGLVTIPVSLYGATEEHSIHFNQYHRGTADRVRYRRINERTGGELSYDDIVKGLEVDGKLITVESQELEDIAPGRSKTIDITSFVDLDDIDPVYFRRTYWLAPTSHQHDRPYNLLRRAMAETNRAGIATFVLHGKEHLTAVRADGQALAMETLFFADEVRDPAELVGGPADLPATGSNELRMATDLIDSMSDEWQPEEYHDTYTARVEQLLQDKSRGRTPRIAEEPPAPTEVVELGEALRRSADMARRGRSSRGRGRPEAPQPADTSSGGGRPQGSSRQRRGSGDAGAETVSTLSRTELDRRARELDIKGRSKLNRAQLEKAVAEAPTAHRGGKTRQRGEAS